MRYTKTEETFVTMPVTYRGIRFRSKLEARWAVFFDLCGAEWEYEPDVSVPGVYYQPDFLVKDVLSIHGFCGDDNPAIPVIGNLFVEVKGRMSSEDAEKVEKFSEEHSILVVTDFPKGKAWSDLFRSAMDGVNRKKHKVNLQYNFDTVDGDAFELMPAVATRNGIPFMALVGADSNYERWADHKATERAYSIARNAKFDHGQAPSDEYIDAIHNIWMKRGYNSLGCSTTTSMEDEFRRERERDRMINLELEERFEWEKGHPEEMKDYKLGQRHPYYDWKAKNESKDQKTEAS